MIRTVVLCVALLFIVGFAVLTITSVHEQGFTVGSALSILVLLLLSAGIIAALRGPPQ